ncbi:MAG: hypothetical protein U0790_10100 [Isosphaeraceae bacterium]
MKITDVEAIVLESPYENRPPEGSEEVHGVKHCSLLKVTTDQGLVGRSDIETAPHVALRAAVTGAFQRSGRLRGAPRAGRGGGPVRGRAPLGQGLPHDLLRAAGVAIQLLSGFDIARHDIMGKATGLPVHKLIGARRKRVRAYASTLFRPTADAIRRSCEFAAARGSYLAVKFGWGVWQDRRDISPRRGARDTRAGARIAGRSCRWSCGSRIRRDRSLSRARALRRVLAGGFSIRRPTTLMRLCARPA